MDRQPQPKAKTEMTTPQNHRVFDPWNSSASGHQRADGPSASHTTAWRDTRADKLSRQFAFGDCRGGDKDGDGGGGEWRWIKDDDANADANAKRNGCRDIRQFMAVNKKRKIDVDEGEVQVNKGVKRIAASTSTSTSTSAPVPVPEPEPAQHQHTRPPQAETEAQILTGATIYINGSTMPLISDHKLKRLLVAHGAKLSLVLARNSVTHVIIGRPATGPASGTGIGTGKGAGGGLAASKLQKEIEKGKGNFKVVGVEWYVPPPPLSR